MSLEMPQFIIYKEVTYNIGDWIWYVKLPHDRKKPGEDPDYQYRVGRIQLIHKDGHDVEFVLQCVQPYGRDCTMPQMVYGKILMSPDFIAWFDRK